MSTRVLVIPTSQVKADEVGAIVGDRFGADAEVHVVAPASGLSRLDWLTNAEDDARADAAKRAAAVADAVPTEQVDAHFGDTDPIQAIDDAVQLFHPDQIVIVTASDEDVSWLEIGLSETARSRFKVPVTHLVGAR